MPKRPGRRARGDDLRRAKRAANSRELHIDRRMAKKDNPVDQCGDAYGFAISAIRHNPNQYQHASQLRDYLVALADRINEETVKQARREVNDGTARADRRNGHLA
jgi:hypothetical protein